jgi:hypothetical protein
MALFDWQGAIVRLAEEVEGIRMCDANPMFADGVGHDRRIADIERSARWAAYLARSYCRKGRKAKAA